jgi:hypothetical protein
MARIVAHVLESGETKSGKTFHANRLHREWPGPSLFFNTNEVQGVWGQRVPSLEALPRTLASSQKVVYTPSRRPEVAAEEFLHVVSKFMSWGREAKRRGLWKEGSDPWGQIVGDETSVLARRTESGEDPVVTLAARGLNSYGVRFVAIVQHPGMLETDVRTNFPVRVLFKPGAEGARFLESYRVPGDVLQHVEQRFHFASYAPGRGWRRHQPLPRA